MIFGKRARSRTLPTAQRPDGCTGSLGIYEDYPPVGNRNHGYYSVVGSVACGGLEEVKLLASHALSSRFWGHIWRGAREHAHRQVAAQLTLGAVAVCRDCPLSAMCEVQEMHRATTVTQTAQALRDAALFDQQRHEIMRELTEGVDPQTVLDKISGTAPAIGGGQSPNNQ